MAAISVNPAAREEYPFTIDEGDPFHIDMCPSIEAIVRDIADGVAAGEISARFHLAMAHVIADSCERLRVSRGLNRVCLSGGTFQNLRLLGHAVQILRDRGFEVFTHRQVPANDGGLSLGQAVIASCLICGARTPACRVDTLVDACGRAEHDVGSSGQRYDLRS
jgi:hydrogenase maturation protein HypF